MIGACAHHRHHHHHPPSTHMHPLLGISSCRSCGGGAGGDRAYTHTHTHTHAHTCKLTYIGRLSRCSSYATICNDSFRVQPTKKRLWLRGALCPSLRFARPAPTSPELRPCPRICRSRPSKRVKGVKCVHGGGGVGGLQQLPSLPTYPVLVMNIALSCPYYWPITPPPPPVHRGRVLVPARIALLTCRIG